MKQNDASVSSFFIYLLIYHDHSQKLSSARYQIYCTYIHGYTTYTYTQLLTSTLDLEACLYANARSSDSSRRCIANPKCQYPKCDFLSQPFELWYTCFVGQEVADAGSIPGPTLHFLVFALNIIGGIFLITLFQSVIWY